MNYSFLEGRTVDACIHSKDGALDEVTIITAADCNNIVASYNGKKYTAILNGFNGLVYVDDLYGEIQDS